MNAPTIAAPSTWAGARQRLMVLTTLALAAACWVVAAWQMSGMDMGVATTLGSFPSFVAVWIVMMAAMMLPGATPAAAKARAGHRLLFLGAYLAVWAVVGAAAYVIYRPHGALPAALIVIAAGLYELSPLKRYFRRRCRDDAGSGYGYGLCCTGSSVGLMAMLLALGVMSIAWMVVISAVVTAQKLLPGKLAVDVPLGLAIIGLGTWIAVAPSMIPGLIPAM